MSVRPVDWNHLDWLGPSGFRGGPVGVPGVTVLEAEEWTAGQQHYL